MNLLEKIIIVVILLGFNLSVSNAYYNPGKPSGFVNDFAEMLSSEEKQTLESALQQFEKESSNEITVVTISSLKGDYIENFAVKLFEDWQFGKKGKDNGVLILIAKEDREMKIEVGYGLEGALPDSRCAEIINNIMKPAFRSEEYYLGISQAIDKIISATKEEYVPTKDNVETPFMASMDTILTFGFFGILWLASILGRSKSWWMGGVIGGVIGIIIGIINGFLYLGLTSILIFVPIGLFFDYIVSKNYEKGIKKGHIPWWIGGGKGGSGGFGGGSSFGGFGGGRSGGGGASGSW